MQIISFQLIGQAKSWTGFDVWCHWVDQLIALQNQHWKALWILKATLTYALGLLVQRKCFNMIGQVPRNPGIIYMEAAILKYSD